TEGQTAEDDGDHGGRKEKKEQAKEEASDCFAAGGSLEAGRKRLPIAGRIGQRRSHLSAAFGTKTGVIRDGLGTIGAVHGRKRSWRQMSEEITANGICGECSLDFGGRPVTGGHGSVKRRIVKRRRARDNALIM